MERVEPKKGLGKGGMSHKHRKRPLLSDKIQGITKPAIKRLVLQAGVPRTSGRIYEETRGALKSYLEKLMKSATKYIKYGRRSTFKSEDFLHAYEHVTGKKFYGGAPDTLCKKFMSAKGKKTSPGKLTVRKIKHYQKQNDCFMIGKNPFNRLVREIGQEYSNEDTRYSKIFLNMVHAAAEEYLVSLFRDSFLLAVNSGRTTVYFEDIQLVKRLRDERE